MQLKSRRADYVDRESGFYQDNDIPIWRYATAGHFEGGDFNILEPGFVLIGFLRRAVPSAKARSRLPAG